MPTDDDPVDEIYKTLGLSRPAPRPPRRKRSEVAKALRSIGSAPPASHPLAPSGPKLKVLREASGWTVDEIADRTRVPLATLTEFEQGNPAAAEDLTIADLERLVSACCGELSDILTPEARREAKRKEERRKSARLSSYDPFDF